MTGKCVVFLFFSPFPPPRGVRHQWLCSRERWEDRGAGGGRVPIRDIGCKQEGNGYQQREKSGRGVGWPLIWKGNLGGRRDRANVYRSQRWGEMKRDGRCEIKKKEGFKVQGEGRRERNLGTASFV